MPPKKAAIIGLDCFDYRIPTEFFPDVMTNMRRLMSEGRYGRIESTRPTITIPAWACMVTGCDPGTLGIYGFRNRFNYTYQRMGDVTSMSLREPTIWDMMGQMGREVIVIGVPPSYPPQPVNGIQVSGMLAPRLMDVVKQVPTYPRELFGEIKDVIGRYPFDINNFRTHDYDRILDEALECARVRFDLAEHLITNKPWELMMMMEIGSDRVHHVCWRFIDPEHRSYDPSPRAQERVRQYYKYLDDRIGRLVDRLDLEKTLVLIVSDHGARRMEGGICINEWLIQQGLLVLKNPMPSEPTDFGKVEVDWDRTKVWSEGGYYGRIFFNVKGREANGQVSRGDYGAFREDLVQRLADIPGPDGTKLSHLVYKPEDIYRIVRNYPPDLMVDFGNLYWRSIGSVGYGKSWTYENDTGPDYCNHDRDNAIYIAVGAGVAEHGERHDQSIYEIAPTVLALLEAPIAVTMTAEPFMEP